MMVDSAQTVAFDDLALVAQAKQGDRSAFTELVNRHARKIFRLARHITKNDTRTKVIADMIHLGMLQRTATHLRLTREGVCLADAILSQLL